MLCRKLLVPHRFRHCFKIIYKEYCSRSCVRGMKRIEIQLGLLTIDMFNTHPMGTYTVYPKKYAHGFCFAVLCCGYTLTGFPISIRLTSLALWQSNDCPSASKATLMDMDKYFMWIHYKRLHNHNKAKHNKTVCIFLGIYYIYPYWTLEEVSLNLAWNMHPHGAVTISVQYQLTTKFPLYCLVSSGNNNLERTVIH